MTHNEPQGSEIGEDALNVIKHIRGHVTDLSSSDYGTEIDTHTLHASQLGYCKRQMYIKKLGLEEHPDWLTKVFRTGTAYHTAIEQWIDQLDDLRSARTEVPMQFKQWTGNGQPHKVTVTGRADVLTRRHVIDWKTMSGIGPVRDNGPKTHHIRQLTAYLHGHDRDSGVLHYIDKKTGEQETFTVTYSKDLLDKCLHDASQVMDIVEKVKLTCSSVGVAFNAENVTALHTEGVISIPFPKCQRDDGDPCFMCRDENLLNGVKE